MTNDKPTGRAELPKLFDDGADNNYGSWKNRSYYKLREWGLWKYIEGPGSVPPTVPALCPSATYHGVDDDGHLTTAHVRGNEEEHRVAVATAEPWHAGNELALGRIYTALPDQSLHLLLGITHAKDAWECLRANYQPQNSARAAAMKGQIMTYRCTADMNVAKWLTDMQRLYTRLCGIEVERMTDREFALAILDLMPQDNIWTSFVSGLRDKLHEADSHHTPFRSVTLISRIRDEHWCRHKDDDKTQATVFTARYDAMNKTTGNKRGRGDEVVATASTSVKRARNSDPDKPKPRCTNPHCLRQLGHETTACIAYMGAKQGQYPDWWRGPWNIHLPESQRTAATNVAPKNRGANRPPLAAQTHVDRSTTKTEPNDVGPDVNAVFTPSSDVNSHAWSILADDEPVHITVNALDPNLSRDDTCHHDTGANRHVFHNRNAFATYEPTQPVTVRGFGNNLSTIAIGCGTVRLESHCDRQTHRIDLQNVLHVPAARTNLISGIQLDKAGVRSTLGDASISLLVNGRRIVEGKMINDMYRLNVKVTSPDPAPLASRLSAPTLISRLESRASTHGPDFYTA
jgi:hypothetical protein